MKSMVTMSQAVLIAALMGMAITGCERKAADTGTTGTANPPASTNGPGTAATPPAPATAPSTGAAPSTTPSTGTESAGAAIDDSVITTKVKAALLADQDVKGSDISVETKGGEVMLSGAVKDQAQIDKALKVANSVEGVKGINNKMTVKQ
jgi:hyperosmotically inducible periplasmic protein